MKRLLAGCCIVIVVFAIGCASAPLEISNIRSNEYEKLGEGKGSAVGIMLFDVIPIGQNDRFERAYQAAVESQGGDTLLNPVISEKWFWGYILNGYITTVSGTVIKFKE